MTAVFDAELRAQAEQVKARYPAGRERSAIMPLLYLAQSQQGHLSREALQEIGGLLDITTAEVEAVATFYTMYRLHPTGEHLINVCTRSLWHARRFCMMAKACRAPARSRGLKGHGSAVWLAANSLTKKSALTWLRPMQCAG